MVPLEDARQYLDIGDSVTGIAIKVNDVFNANKLVRDAGSVTNNYVHQSWIGTTGMYRDIQMIRAIMYLAMVLVIGVACLISSRRWLAAVKDKSGDIAVLRTLGARTVLFAPSLSGMAAGGAVRQPVRGGDWRRGVVTAYANHQRIGEADRPPVPVG